MTEGSEVEGRRELVSLSYEGEEFSVPRELLEDVSERVGGSGGHQLELAATLAAYEKASYSPMYEVLTCRRIHVHCKVQVRVCCYRRICSRRCSLHPPGGRP